MATPEEFFARMLPYARKVSERTGIDPRVIIAQAALETGYGQSAPNNNYFGIKSTGQGGQTLPTTEYVNGKPVQMDQSFRTYGDMGQSAEDYGSFILKNPRYADVLSATGLDEQIAALGKSGYATDPNYAAKLKNIAGKINLNAPQNIASDTMTALGRGTDRAKLPQNSGTMMSGLLDASTNRQEKKMGLLDQLGIQKRDPNAQGDAARPFYQRDQFKNAMGDLALAFNTLRMNPDQNLAASVAAGQERRSDAKLSSRTMDYLASQPAGAAYAEIIKAGGNPATALKAFIDAQQTASQSGTRVQSSQFLYGGIVQNIMSDGSVSVKTPDGKTLSGQEAIDAIQKANEANVASQKDIYGARRTGTLQSDVELGAAAAAAGKTGEQSVAIGKEYFDKYRAVTSSLSNIDRAIAAIDAGANSGVIANAFPNITAASGELRSAMNSLGLDVVAGTTFGALSASELQLALETAVPTDLGPVELKNWLVARRAAQSKAAQELANVAAYFSSGGSIGEWLKSNTGVEGVAVGRQSAATPITTNQGGWTPPPGVIIREIK